MELFKSVFPTTTPNPQTTPPPSSSLFHTMANNYYKDLQEFTSTLKQETSLFTQAATRAVHDRLDSGAAIAQLSLEAVGDVIDNLGSTLSHVIIGKDSNFTNASSSNVGIKNSSNLLKTYSRIDAIIRGLQCDVKTYCEEIDESGYDEWRIGFRIDEKREEIDKLLGENGVIGDIFDEVVPNEVDENVFWCRYFYRVGKVIKREELRLSIVKKAIFEEDEELSWDFDDDDDDNNGKGVSEIRMEDKAGVSGEKGDMGIFGESVEGGLKVEDKAGSEGRVESDFSVISSQRSSHVGEDFSWDEIEGIGSGCESKVRKEAGLQKESSDEELTWDIEEDDQPIKT